MKEAPSNRTYLLVLAIFLAFAIFLSQDISATGFATFDSSLIGYWKFDEGSGVAIHDSRPERYSGLPIRLNGEAKNANRKSDDDCKSGGCLEFVSKDEKREDVNSYVAIPSSGYAPADLYSVRDKFTVEAWIYPTSFETSDPSGRQRIFTRDEEIILMLSNHLDHEKSLFGWVETTSGDTTKTGIDTSVWAGKNSITLNKWQHVAMVYDGSKESKNLILYINGEEKDSKNLKGKIVHKYTAGIRIGNSFYFTRQFLGRIDEVKFYERALSQEEIKTSIESAKPAPAPTPTTLGLINLPSLPTVTLTNRLALQPGINFIGLDSSVDALEKSCGLWELKDASGNNRGKAATVLSGTAVKFEDIETVLATATTLQLGKGYFVAVTGTCLVDIPAIASSREVNIVLERGINAISSPVGLTQENINDACTDRMDAAGTKKAYDNGALQSISSFDKTNFIVGYNTGTKSYEATNKASPYKGYLVAYDEPVNTDADVKCTIRIAKTGVNEFKIYKQKGTGFDIASAVARISG